MDSRHKRILHFINDAKCGKLHFYQRESLWAKVVSWVTGGMQAQICPDMPWNPQRVRRVGFDPKRSFYPVLVQKYFSPISIQIILSNAQNLNSQNVE
jgi:hypothetical protein